MPIAQSLLLANLASAWFMTGLIWFVQVVHYPQFRSVGRDAFISYHANHTRLTTWVVGPPMLIEAGTAVGLVWQGSGWISAQLAWGGLILLAIVWLSTALLQVPRHDLLAKGWDAKAGGFLCSTNWIRTIAWTARAALMLYAVARTMHA